MNFKKITTTLCLALTISLGIGSQVYAAPSQKRLSGNDRYGTSTAISKLGWETTSDYAVIAFGGDFPDALSAAPLAKKYNAPIFLTSKTSLDNVSSDTDSKVSDELKRLKVKTVYIVGGTSSVSQGVEDQIKTIKNNGNNIEVVRIAGSDRFSTALKVAKEVGIANGVVITTGMKFPDALSMSPIAASKGMPIILVQKDGMTKEVSDYLQSKNLFDENAPTAYILGGEQAVGTAVEGKFKKGQRLSGNDAYETNVKILNTFSDSLNYDTAFIATRNSFADALAGSALAALNASPIVLTGDAPTKSTEDFLKGKMDSIKNLHVLGGQNAVKQGALLTLTSNSPELADLLAASGNTMAATSMEGSSNITMKVSATGMPKESQQEMADIFSLVNGMTIKANSKTSSNAEHTLSKSQVDVNIDSLMGPVEASIWANTDLTNSTPVVKEIIKLPSLLTSTLPEQYAGKEYMVVDSSSLNATAGEGSDVSQTTPVDTKELLELNKNLTDQIAKLVQKYVAAGTLDPNFLAYKGQKTLKINSVDTTTSVYEVSFTNGALNQLLNAAGSTSDLFKTLKDLELFGKDGIKLTFYVSNGFIVAQDASINLQFNLQKLGQVFGAVDPSVESQVPAEDLKGVITLQLNIASQNYNINKDVQVTLPEVNADNSFNYTDLMNTIPSDGEISAQ